MANYERALAQLRTQRQAIIEKMTAAVAPLQRQLDVVERQIEWNAARELDQARDLENHVVYYCNPEDGGCGKSIPTEGYPSMSTQCTCGKGAYRRVVIDGVPQPGVC